MKKKKRIRGFFSTGDGRGRRELKIYSSEWPTDAINAEAVRVLKTGEKSRPWRREPSPWTKTGDVDDGRDSSRRQVDFQVHTRKGFEHTTKISAK